MYLYFTLSLTSGCRFKETKFCCFSFNRVLNQHSWTNVTSSTEPSDQSRHSPTRFSKVNSWCKRSRRSITGWNRHPSSMNLFLASKNMPIFPNPIDLYSSSADEIFPATGILVPMSILQSHYSSRCFVLSTREINLIAYINDF